MADCEYLTAEPGECWCGKKLTGRQRKYCSRDHGRKVTAEHRWTQAKAAAKKKVTFYQCERCAGYFDKVEVNHIIPCRGKHGTWGCHHHSKNLEVLCKPCHKTETDEQRERGWK